MLSLEAKNALILLGQRIKEERLKRNEKQSRFAVRLGVSVPTLRKLESGDPTVSLGVFAETVCLFEKLSDLERLFSSKKDLFSEWEQTKRPKLRKRASSAGKK